MRSFSQSLLRCKTRFVAIGGLQGENGLHSVQSAIAEGLIALQHELLLFAAVLFAVGVIDELAVDAIYAWNRLTGRIATTRLDTEKHVGQPLSGPAAVFIPAWQESAVIGSTLAHALAVWPQKELRIYAGCYRNDPMTIASVASVAREDIRIRLVTVDEDGPTSKAHCLNRLYQALCEDEAREGERAHMIVLHDAEDMVDPAALHLLDNAIGERDFAQLPVIALPSSNSPWVAGHYSDEFAESHAKAMVVRDLLGCAVPGAGVGSAISREMLDKLAHFSGGWPFAEDSLTEDYELGLRVHALGGRGNFIRVRTQAGELVATRAFFPSTIKQAVRQKTRWTHGIALQGWDRLGWEGPLLQRWMILRDRKGPLASILLGIAYLLVLGVTLSLLASNAGWIPPIELSPAVRGLLFVTSVGLLWRVFARAVFTTREHGLKQGLLAIPRVIVSNVIAILSGHRALTAYIGALRGAPFVWDKTDHQDHPAFAVLKESSK